MSDYAMTCMHGNEWYVFRNLRIYAARRIRRVVISLGIDRGEHHKKWVHLNTHKDIHVVFACACVYLNHGPPLYRYIRLFSVLLNV